MSESLWEKDAGARVLDYLHTHRHRMRDLLERLVELESPSMVPASQGPVQAVLRDALGNIGYRSRILAGRTTGGTLYASPDGRRPQAPCQLILGHTDTIWPIGTLDEMPLREDRGRLYGPGIFDMKAGLVQGVFAVEALRRCLGEPEVTPVFVCNSDEEIGSPDSREHIVRLAMRADRALVLEPSLGERGRLKTTRKGGGDFTVHVTGVAAHAGLEPDKGVSAILELAHVIRALHALNDPVRGVNVNVGTIEGGIRPNVIAPEASAEVDVRVPTLADARRVERAIRAIEATVSGSAVEIRGVMDRPPMEKTPGNRRLWELAREAGARLGLELEESMSGGGSDGNTTSLYTPTLDGLGAVGAGAHASHEHVSLERMPERAALLALLLAAPSMRLYETEESPASSGSVPRPEPRR